MGVRLPAALLVQALAIAASLAGCASPAAPDADAPLTASTARVLQVLHETDVVWTGPVDQAFAVEVPAGAANVTLEVEGAVNIAFGEFAFELTGCGTFDRFLAFHAELSERLCWAAEPGPQSWTLAGSAVGQGHVRLVARVPAP